MASWEFELLNELVASKDFRTIQRNKITASDFVAEECKAVFRYIERHYKSRSTHGKVPSKKAIRSRFPNFPWEKSTDDLATICQLLKQDILTCSLFEALNDISSTAEQDPNNALALMRKVTMDLTRRHEADNDMSLADAHDALLAEYQQVVQGGGITGIPFPWDILNTQTQGIHKQDLVVVYGRPKSMKTWIGLYIGMHAYMKGRQRVLIMSLEMPPKTLIRRCASILAEVPYWKVKQGKLDEEEQHHFFSTLADLKIAEKEKDDSKPTLRITGRGPGGAGGVGFLQSKIEDIKPDLVIVDGMYLMRDDRQGKKNMDWKSMAHISQDLKETAAVMDIPILGITQEKRKSKGGSTGGWEADLDEIAYADAIAQDCDLAINVRKRKDPKTEERELMLQFPGDREGSLDAFMINGDPGGNFSYRREVRPSDYLNEDGKKAGKGAPKEDYSPPERFTTSPAYQFARNGAAKMETHTQKPQKPYTNGVH